MTFRTTALIPDAGSPPLLYTLNVVDAAVPVRLPIFPVERVSMIRLGDNVISPGVATLRTATWGHVVEELSRIHPIASACPATARAKLVVTVFVGVATLVVVQVDEPDASRW